jgi:PilZ domain
MEIQVPPFKEKRQFGRINIRQPMICQVYVPQSRKRKGYRGLIRNISLKGIYFICEEKLPLAKDDIRHVILNVIYNYQKLYRLKFHSSVVRTENKASQFAVALKFLSDPIYYPINELEATELPFLDKPRILYQNYELYKKAYAIIINLRTFEWIKLII